MTNKRSPRDSIVDSLKEEFTRGILHLTKVSDFRGESKRERLTPVQFPSSVITYALSELGEEPTRDILNYVSEHASGLSGSQGSIDGRISQLFDATLGTIEIMANGPFFLPEEVFGAYSLEQVRGHANKNGLDSDVFEIDYSELVKDEVSRRLDQMKTFKALRVGIKHGYSAFECEISKDTK